MTFFYHHKSKYAHHEQSSVTSEAKDDYLNVDEASQIEISVSSLLSNDTTGYTTTHSSTGDWYWSQWSCWSKDETKTELDSISLVSVQGANHGTVVLEGDTIIFTPESGYSGPAIFTYTLSDGKGGMDEATVNLNIVDVNQAPVAIDDAIAGESGAPIVIDPASLLANDSDPDGDVISIVSLQNPQNGTVDFVNGAIVFTPDAGYVGPAQFEYSISDNVPTDTLTYYTDAHGNIGTLNLETGERDVIVDTPKVFHDIAMGDDGQLYAMEHGQTLYSVDKESGELTYIGKTACDNINGLVAGAEGKLYGVSDAKIYEIDQETAEAVVLDIPQLGSAGDVVFTDGKLFITTDHDQLVSYDLGTKQTEVVIENLPDCKSYGISLTAEGLIAGVTSSDEIYYVDIEKGEIILTGIETHGADIYGLASAQTHVAATATVKVDVVAANAAPDAVDDVLAAGAEGAITIDPATLLANDSDADGDALLGVSVQDPVNGTVMYDGTNIVFTPTEGYQGPASFTYTITDGKGGVDTATVSLDVNGILKPDQPSAAPDMTAAKDTGISDQDDLTSDTTPSFTVSVPEGLLPQLYVDGQKVLANYDAAQGTLTPFEPLGDGDHEVTYSLINNGVESDPSPALPIQIDTVAPILGDVAPDMTPDTDTGLSDSDDYTANTTPSFEIGEVGENTPTLYIDGIAVPSVYEPINQTLTPTEPLAEGTHAVTYSLTDPAGNESEQSQVLPIEINTAPENHNPEAYDDAHDQQTVGALTCSVDVLLANDTDADGDALQVISVQDAMFGTVELMDGQVTFTPMDGYQGPASFTYTVSDGKGGTDTAEVKLLVDGREVIFAPETAPDLTAETDTGVSDSDDLTSDTTPEFAIQDPGEYTAVLYVNGQEVPATYDADKGVLTPDNPLPNGELAITYALRNDQGQESPMSEALNIVVDDQISEAIKPADMTPDSDTGISNTDDITSDGTPSFEIDAPEGLTPQLYVDGVPVESSFDAQTNQLTPVNPLSDGSHSISYKLIDDAGNETPLSEPLSVLVDTVAPEVGNIALTPDSDTGESNQDGVTDDTTPTFSIDPVTDAQPTLYINGQPVAATYDDVNYTLTPTEPLPEGQYSVSYSLKDTAGNVSLPSEPVSVTVTSFDVPVENAAPQATDDLITDFVEGVVTINPALLLANDTDADNDILQGVSVQDAQNGSVSFDGTNILFTPNEGYVGEASFTYTISDGQGGMDTATVTIEKVDGVPMPAAPTNQPDLIAVSDTGISDSDDITADRTPSFEIGDVGDLTPTLYINGEKVEAAFENGLLTPTAELPDGEYTVTYTLTNAGGKESAPSGALVITITPDDGGNNGNNDDGNFIYNGSFEDTTGMDTTDYGYSAQDGQIPGWTDKDGYLIDVHNDGRSGLNATDGNNWLDLGGIYSNNHVMQTINGLENGQSYELSFDVGDAVMDADGTSADNTLTVIWGGEVIAVIDPADGVMERYTFTVQGGAGDGADRLEFKGGGEIDNVGVSIDKVRLVSIDSDTAPDNQPPVIDSPESDTSDPQPGALHFNDYTPGVDNPPPAGWYTDNPGGVIEVFPHDAYGVGGTPTNVLELERYGEDAGNFYTYVASEADQPITLAFDYSARSGANDGENSAIHILIDGEVYETINTQEVGFTHFEFMLNGTGEPMRIEFQSADTSGVGGLLDNIYVSEPPLYLDGLPEITPDLPVEPPLAEEPPVVEDPAPEEPPMDDEPPILIEVPSEPAPPEEPPVLETPVEVENFAPDAQDDYVDGLTNNAIIISPETLLGNDYDADGDALQGVSVQDAVNGTVEFDGTNVIFTPNDGYIGEASFTYTVTDGKGGYDSATVNLTVAPVLVEEPPIVEDPAPEVPPLAEDEPPVLIEQPPVEDATDEVGSGYLLTFDDYTPNEDSELPPGWYTDNPGNLIEVLPSEAYGVPGESSNVLSLEHGSEEPSNFYTFVKAELGETITLSFDYSPSKDHEEDDDSAIQIIVDNEVIDTISATATGFETYDYVIPATGEPMLIKFQAVDQNADGGLLDNIRLNVTPLDILPQEAEPTTPAEEPPVLVDEVPVNLSPEANDDVLESLSPGVVVIDPQTLLANDNDGDGDSLSGLSVQDAVNGTVAINGEKIIFTPFDGYQGPASFTYTVSDGRGGIDKAAVNLTIAAGAPLASELATQALVEQMMTLDMNAISTGMNVGLSGGWKTDNAGGQVEVNQSTAYGIPGESRNVLELERNEGDPSNLYTTVQAAEGEPVRLAFDFSPRSGYEGADSTIHVLVNGKIVESVSANTVGFSHYEFSFEGTGEPMRVELQAADSNSTGGLIDSLQLGYMITQAVASQQSVSLDMDSLARGMNAGLPGGWATDNAGGKVEVNSASVYGIPGESRNVLELERNEGDVSNLYTHVTAQAGEAVTLSFDYSARGGYDASDSAVNIMVNGVVIDTVIPETVGFNHYQFSFTGTGEPMRVELKAVDSNSTGGLVDNIRIDYTAPGTITQTAVEVDGPVIATSGDDTFDGTSRDEVVLGLEGNDTLNGGAGNDVIDAGEGDDVIVGGQGFDAMTGGVGADTFTWSLSDVSESGATTDIITDFNNGQDAIDLKDILVGESHDAETLSNYLHFETDGDKTTLHISSEGKFAHGDSGEVDGNTVAENTTQIIELDGVDLTAGGSMSDLQVIQNLISNNQLITD